MHLVIWRKLKLAGNQFLYGTYTYLKIQVVNQYSEC